MNLTLEQELNLGKEIKNGSISARNTLIQHNLNLVKSIAKNYANRGLDMDDIIGYGNLGLVKALNNYDYTKGYKFSTFAVNWIKQAIQRGLEEDTRHVHLPEYVITKITKLNKVRTILTGMLNREPTVLELAENSEFTIDEVKELIAASLNTISLSTKVSYKDEDMTLEDTCASSDETPVEYTERIERRAKIEKAFSQLSSRNAEVMRLRFGFTDNTEYSVAEIATKLNLSRMYINNIINKNLERLKVLLK